MKIIAKTAACLALLLLGACAENKTEAPLAAAIPPPAETAEQFVARANAELAELLKETGAAEWVRDRKSVV